MADSASKENVIRCYTKVSTQLLVVVGWVVMNLLFLLFRENIIAPDFLIYLIIAFCWIAVIIYSLPLFRRLAGKPSIMIYSDRVSYYLPAKFGFRTIWFKDVGHFETNYFANTDNILAVLKKRENQDEHVQLNVPWLKKDDKPEVVETNIMKQLYDNVDGICDALNQRLAEYNAVNSPVTV